MKHPEERPDETLLQEMKLVLLDTALEEILGGVKAPDLTGHILRRLNGAEEQASASRPRVSRGAAKENALKPALLILIAATVLIAGAVGIVLLRKSSVAPREIAETPVDSESNPHPEIPSPEQEPDEALRWRDSMFVINPDTGAESTASFAAADLWVVNDTPESRSVSVGKRSSLTMHGPGALRLTGSTRPRLEVAYGNVTVLASGQDAIQYHCAGADIQHTGDAVFRLEPTTPFEGDPVMFKEWIRPALTGAVAMASAFALHVDSGVVAMRIAGAEDGQVVAEGDSAEIDPRATAPALDGELVNRIGALLNVMNLPNLEYADLGSPEMKDEYQLCYERAGEAMKTLIDMTFEHPETRGFIDQGLFALWTEDRGKGFSENSSVSEQQNLVSQILFRKPSPEVMEKADRFARDGGLDKDMRDLLWLGETHDCEGAASRMKFLIESDGIDDPNERALAAAFLGFRGDSSPAVMRVLEAGVLSDPKSLNETCFITAGAALYRCGQTSAMAQVATILREKCEQWKNEDVFDYAQYLVSCAYYYHQLPADVTPTIRAKVGATEYQQLDDWQKIDAFLMELSR